MLYIIRGYTCSPSESQRLARSWGTAIMKNTRAFGIGLNGQLVFSQGSVALNPEGDGLVTCGTDKVFGGFVRPGLIGSCMMVKPVAVNFAPMKHDGLIASKF